GADGYASIEVSPVLAYDTDKTVEAGVRIFSALSRPNIMIKVPATDRGIPAVKELLRRGINVNITLIFSVDVYNQVMNAYLEGLEARLHEGKKVDSIASVASFFVSRVDSIVEKELAKRRVDDSVKGQFLGKIGIANSKVAYAKFEEFIASSRFKQ